METIINSLSARHWIDISHASDIAAARRAGQRMALGMGFDDTRIGQLAIVITEAATNMLKHAGHGRMFLQQAATGTGAVGIDVLAFDSGPGIFNLAQALRDGVSSTGTAGTGLGALHRLADEFDVYAPRGKGAIFFMRLLRAPALASVSERADAGSGLDTGVSAGGVCLPLAGEDESGDAWALAASRKSTTLMLVDGLGHGADAAVAAKAALDCLAARPLLRPRDQIDACHVALRPTRGAALAVAQLTHMARDAHELYFAGVGNISACIIDGATRRQMVSHNGIVGHNMRKVQEFTHPCPPGSLIVMHSDGINTQWDLEQYPGLAACNPAIIAALLLRDFSRVRDDACVLVYRYHGEH